MRGILGRFLAGGQVMRSGHFALLPTRLGFGRLDTRHGYQVLLPQAQTAELLEDRARELGAGIRRGCAVTGIVQDADVVAVTAEDGTVARARYVVGCDGAASVVRTAAG